ncbi:hypothetical protein [Streptomyces sp. NPDC012888]|uniref:hypothetical protein n=1 Tax=Streptomyces sp. NPDC012888 TaxID=3364855 RepID=UPI0036A4F88E
MDRGRRRRRLVAAVLAVLGTAVVAGAAEVAATTVVENRIEDALRPRLGDTTAELTGPGLLTLPRGRAGSVTVSGEEARFGRLSGASVRLRLDGIALTGGTAGEVDSLRGTVTLPTAALRALLVDTRPGLPVGEVAADPATGTLRAGFGPGDALTVALRPQLDGGRLGFTATEVTLLGRPAPEHLVSGIRERLAELPQGSAGPPLPGAEPVSLRVTERGVELAVAARHPTLTAPRPG